MYNKDFEYAFTSEDFLNEDEDEDLSRAIELSIEEANQTGPNVDDVESSEDDEDTQLATALEESFKSSRKSRTNFGTGSRWWKGFQSLNIVKNLKQVGQTSGKNPIRMGDTDDQAGLICDVCDEPVDPPWSRCPYWRQTFCEKHRKDGTPSCCSCSRYKSGGIRYINLSDGRKLCPDCHSTAIVDIDKFNSLFLEVYTFFKGLNMKTKKDVPLFLIDMHEHGRIVSKEFNEEIRERPSGLTTCREQPIKSIARFIRTGDDIEVVEETQYLTRKHIVTGVLIVYGFPKLATGATLAHEMMHVWMRLEGYRVIEPEVEEGLCEVIAHKWLEHHAFVGDDPKSRKNEQTMFLRNLKELLKEEIEQRYDRKYGHGFREAKWAVERYGLKYIMEHIAQTGKFPQV